ncbi:putative vacuolar membrane transporter [Marasmius tenuissimus]|uniref:Vacuolar membrane transporter n=1 Tax=Marasmius tenuissimus TaxID=585030 RepID=A0ABR3AB86_9AGAR
MLSQHPTHDSVSSISGWISIACWVVVYTPQIYENYYLQSGEGLSILFVVIWLAGDLCNAGGAILAHLLPTVIILGIWYTFCDVTLLVQIYYYRWKSRTKPSPFFSPERQEGQESENTPLLSGDRSTQHNESGEGAGSVVLRYTGALLFVLATGTIAWWLSNSTEYREEPTPNIPSSSRVWTIQALGWSSAVLFLGSRIPQITKNFKTRCEGLTPALFFFAMIGNITYVVSICVKSMEKQYLITNASWLAAEAAAGARGRLLHPTNQGRFRHFWNAAPTKNSVDDMDSLPRVKTDRKTAQLYLQSVSNNAMTSPFHFYRTSLSTKVVLEVYCILN